MQQYFLVAIVINLHVVLGAHQSYQSHAQFAGSSLANIVWAVLVSWKYENLTCEVCTLCCFIHCSYASCIVVRGTYRILYRLAGFVLIFVQHFSSIW